MPELGEVAHAVSLLQKNIVGKTIRRVIAEPDNLLFVAPLTNELLKSRLEGQKVTSVGRNGKYFWLEFGSSQTLLLHFGMTGWVHIRNVQTHFIAMEAGGDKKQQKLMDTLVAEGKDPKEARWQATDWPPKYTKFILETVEDDEVAYTDPRRLGRARLFEVPASEVESREPLSKLGTDFSQTQPPSAEVVPLILKRRVPVKSLLLDQSVFSGIGNWMADEILYQSRIHPEQYSDTLGTQGATRLYDKVLEVCRTAAETEGNTAAFPKHWLMLHRWGKSRTKKEVQKTAEGYVVGFVTVGGRTSCYVPELQKKIKSDSNNKGENSPGQIDSLASSKRSSRGVKEEIPQGVSDIASPASESPSKPVRGTKRLKTEGM